MGTTGILPNVFVVCELQFRVDEKHREREIVQGRMKAEHDRNRVRLDEIVAIVKNNQSLIEELEEAAQEQDED